MDVPGIRELALAEATDGIAAAFEDIESLAIHCRFANCIHETEPGCAVQSAIAEGGLDLERLKQFRKLQREEAREARALRRASISFNLASGSSALSISRR